MPLHTVQYLLSIAYFIDVFLCAVCTAELMISGLYSSCRISHETNETGRIRAQLIIVQIHVSTNGTGRIFVRFRVCPISCERINLSDMFACMCGKIEGISCESLSFISHGEDD